VSVGCRGSSSSNSGGTSLCANCKPLENGGLVDEGRLELTVRYLPPRCDSLELSTPCQRLHERQLMKLVINILTCYKRKAHTRLSIAVDKCDWSVGHRFLRLDRSRQISATRSNKSKLKNKVEPSQIVESHSLNSSHILKAKSRPRNEILVDIANSRARACDG
jgi:hypothetical protein